MWVLEIIFFLFLQWKITSDTPPPRPPNPASILILLVVIIPMTMCTTHFTLTDSDKIAQSTFIVYRTL